MQKQIHAPRSPSPITLCVTQRRTGDDATLDFVGIAENSSATQDPQASTTRMETRYVRPQSVEQPLPKLLDSAAAKGAFVAAKNHKKNLSRIQSFAAQESKRLRPLMVIQTPAAHDGKNISNFVIGNRFLRNTMRQASSPTTSFDTTQLVCLPGIKIGIYFGVRNQHHQDVSIEQWRTLDPNGVLLFVMLQVNTEIFYRNDLLCSLGLIAATLKNGYFGAVEERDAKHCLDRLTSEDRDAALGFALVAAARGAFLDLVETLLEWGAPADATSDDDGSIPLEIALLRENLSLARLLLKHGASPDLDLVS